MAGPPAKADETNNATKVVLAAVYICMWTCQYLTVKYETNRTPMLKDYFPLIIFWCEFTKFAVSMTWYMKLDQPNGPVTSNFSFLYGAPALVYFVYNMCLYYNVQNVPPTLYNVILHTKLFWSVVMGAVVFKRDVSTNQRVAVVIAVLGAAFQSIADADSETLLKDPDDESPSENFLKTALFGGILVFVQAFMSALGGTVTEICYKRIQAKDGEALHFTVQNIYMYLFGMAIAIPSAIFWSGRELGDIFYVLAIPGAFPVIFMTSAAGLMTGVLLKYLDNVIKSFAGALEVFTITYSAALLLDLCPVSYVTSSCSLGMVAASVLLYYVFPKGFSESSFALPSSDIRCKGFVGVAVAGGILLMCSASSHSHYFASYGGSMETQVGMLKVMQAPGCLAKGDFWLDGRAAMMAYSNDGVSQLSGGGPHPGPHWDFAIGLMQNKAEETFTVLSTCFGPQDKIRATRISRLWPLDKLVPGLKAVLPRPNYFRVVDEATGVFVSVYTYKEEHGGMILSRNPWSFANVKCKLERGQTCGGMKLPSFLPELLLPLANGNPDLGEVPGELKEYLTRLGYALRSNSQ